MNAAKELGKLSRSQLGQLAGALETLDGLASEFAGEIPGKRDKVATLLQAAPPWSHWYERPFLEHLAIAAVVFGLEDDLNKAAVSADPQQIVLDLIDDLPDEAKPGEAFTEQEQALIANLTFSAQGQIEAISQFHRSMSDLLARAREGDDEALFDAVTVDRSVVAAPSITRRIQLAELTGDENFLQQLAKALIRTRPRRPAPELDLVRYLLKALDESAGLNNLSYEKLYEIFVEELQLYPEAGRQDAYAGLKKLIQRRAKTLGT